MRSIEPELVRLILQCPDRVFADTATGYGIAAANVPDRGSNRLMMVAYDELEAEIVAITIHPLEERDIENKQRNGRWVR